MTKTKTVNYTPEQIATITEAYDGDNTMIPEIAAAVGKSVPSVRAKLANLGLYKTAEKAKASGDRVTKTMIAEKIAKETGLNEAETEGLAKANKAALEKIMARLTNS